MDEELYRQIFRTAPFGFAHIKLVEGVVKSSVDFLLIDVNLTFLSIMNIRNVGVKNQKASESLTELVYKDSGLLEFCKDVAINGGQKETKYYSDFYQKWYKVQIFSHEKFFFTMVLVDFTEEYERAVELESFFSTHHDLLCIADTNGYFVKTNKAWSEMLGYSNEYLDNKKFLDFVHPDDLDPTLKALERLNKQEVVIDFTNRYKCKNGEYKYLQWRSIPKEKLIYAIAKDITEQKLTEENLSYKEKQIEQIFYAINDAYWDWHLPSGKAYFNPRYYTMLGFEPDEFPANYENWKNLIHPDDLPYAEKVLNEHIKNKSSGYSCDFRMKTKTGDYKWILGRGKVIEKDENGNAIRLVGSHTDISDRKNIEAKLLESEHKLSMLFDSMTEIVVLHRMIFNEKGEPINYQIYDCNKTFTETTGLEKKEILGRLATDVYKSTKAPYIEKYSKVVLTGKPYQFETYYEPMKKYFFISAVSLGKYEFATITIDVTDIRMAEQAVKDSHARLLAVFDAIDEPVYIADPESYDIYYTNKSVYEIFGDIGEKKCYEYLQNFKEPCSFCTNKKIFGKNFGKVHVWEFQNKTNKHWYKCIDKAILWPDGKKVRYEMAIDITDQKNAREELSQLNKELMLKNKELEQLIYIASHDLRSPLVNISGYSKEIYNLIKDIRKVLSSKESYTPENFNKHLGSYLNEMESCLPFVKNSANQMDRLLSGLLKLSRSGRESIENKKLDMDKIVHKTIDSLSFELHQKNIELITNKLPSCFGDEIQIMQVFSNLIGNAIKFISPERKGRIIINGFVEEDKAVYVVEDNGIGIDPRHHKIIFNIFHQLDPKRTQGEGLGLSIVSQILNRLNGNIWLESSPDKGSSFFVSMPYKT